MIELNPLGSAGISPNGQINYYLHGASGLLYAGKNRNRPNRRGLTGFGRAGLGLLQHSATHNLDVDVNNRTHILFGGGLEYMTKIGLGLRAELISYSADIKYAQFGMVYRIGKRNAKRPAQIMKIPAPTEKPIKPVVMIEPPNPAAALASPCDSLSGVLKGVNFHPDSAELTQSAQRKLIDVANTLDACESQVIISAHTDSRGPTAYNRRLSYRRADAVMLFLRDNGIAPTRLNVRASGESQPIDSNETTQGRLRNRRVELSIQ